MPETRPISERIDLKYVRRRAWPNNWTWGLSLLCVLALVAVALGVEFLKNSPGVYAYSLYSSGTMTHAHAMFGDDCAKCHAPDPEGSRFWLPVQDSLCLNCHDTYATTHFVGHDGKPAQSSYDGQLRVVGGLATT